MALSQFEHPQVVLHHLNCTAPFSFFTDQKMPFQVLCFDALWEITMFAGDTTLLLTCRIYAIGAAARLSKMLVLDSHIDNVKSKWEHMERGHDRECVLDGMYTSVSADPEMWFIGRYAFQSKRICLHTDGWPIAAKHGSQPSKTTAAESTRRLTSTKPHVRSCRPRWSRWRPSCVRTRAAPGRIHAN